MNDLLYRIALKIRPDLESLSGQRRIGGVADVITLLYTLPLALAGIAWLVAVSDLQVLRQSFGPLLLMGVLVFLFNRLSFFLITEIRSGGYANTQGAMDGVVVWSAIFIFGPTALWLAVLWNLVNFFNNIRQADTTFARWGTARVFVSGEAATVLSALTALGLYQRLGGVLPIPGISPRLIAPAMAAFVSEFLVISLIFLGYIAYVAWALKRYFQAPTGPSIHFFFLAIGLPLLSNPFALLAANLYLQDGLIIYLFFITGLILVAFLARRMSWAAESNRQQSSQLQALESLGRDLLTAPPDGSALPALLQEHIPAMFMTSGLLIWIEPERVLLRHASDFSLETGPVREWLRTQKQARGFVVAETLPWEAGDAPHPALAVAPILDVDRGESIGGVYLQLQSLAVSWDKKAIASLIPALESLSAQVASAIHQADVYTETLTLQKTLHELTLARRIQASFLPDVIPAIPGWGLTATLEPARQIAGDFYDFITLPNGRLGILIADVADKGLGPAMYMALSRTLIRTFALQDGFQPADVLGAANRRILNDARANLFVTVFYGVLDPASGHLTYCNAGHTPPYLLSPKNGGGYQTLRNTGMPLGIDETTSWGQETVLMDPGDVLLLYTDGITDAQNNRGEFIDRKAVLHIAQRHLGSSVDQIQAAILQEVHHFVGDAPRFDDLTLVILGRDDVD